MKGFIKIILVAILWAINNIGMAAENTNIQFSATFDPRGLILNPVEKDGVVYTEIGLGELTNSGELGRPDLPVKEFKVSIPADACNITVDAVDIKKEKLVLTNPPMPAQYPGLSSVDYVEPPFVHLKSQFPSNSSDLPTSVTLNEVMTMGGFNKVASILVSPVIWNESDNTIEIYTEATISLSWSVDTKELNNLVVPYFQEARDIAINNTKEVVLNPDDVYKNSLVSLTHASMSRGVSEQGQEYVPYIIVTTQKLAPSLERLAAFRRLRGFQTKIYCIEDILADPMFSEGDIISGINDDAGKLRAFITYAYNTFGSQYFLLAGEYPQIAGRWAIYYGNDNNIEKYISDQYFRDLTTKWIISGDKCTNPYSLSGVSQDVCVARLSLRNPQELNHYMNKLIQYEYNLNNIDLSYLDNAFVMCGSDEDMYKNFDKYSLRYYQNYFKYLDLFLVPKVEDGIVYGHEVIEAMKSNNWGFIDWRGHGHYAGVSSSQKNGYWAYGINAVDADRGYLREENLNGLDTWGNKDYPCWTLSMSCNLSEIGYGHDTYNFAESFILGRNYGGVAFIGNSGPGLKGLSDLLIQNMLDDAYIRYKSRFSIPYVGDIFTAGMGKPTVSNRHVKATIGINSDPLTPLWLKPPHQSSVDNKFRPSFILNTDTVNYATCHLSTGSIYTGKGLVSSFADKDEYVNSITINTRTDMIPFIHSTKMSMISIGYDAYLFTGPLRFYSIGDSYSFKLLNNKNITIEALGDVKVEGTIIVEKGSMLRILSHKPLSMNNCCLESEGGITLDTYYPVEIGGGTIVSKGMKLEINHINDD